MTRLGFGALVLASFSLPAVLAETPAGAIHAQTTRAVPDVLQKTFAYYSTLTSYADTGTIVEDGGGTGAEARFTTYFRRATRDFYFDYEPLWSRSGSLKLDDSRNRMVIWMFKNQMQKYQQSARAHELVDPENGGQVRALQSLEYPTKGASIMIASLLYAQAGLPSALRQIEQAQVVGVEDIDKRRCQKISGTAAAYYPSGQRTGVRPVTLWIDVETQLVRRIFEDTPNGYGGVLRYTFTFEPRANPAIDDAKFQFKVPTGPAAK